MPSSVSPEPYFFMWNSVVPLASKDQPELIKLPCFQHKTCLHLVRVPENRVPPVICPWCGTDTIKEAILDEKLRKQGGIVLNPRIGFDVS